MNFEPAMDWEDASHAISAIASLVGMAVDVYRALKGDGDEEEQPSEPQIGVQAEDGTLKVVPISEFLSDHEARLRALEGSKEGIKTGGRKPTRKKNPGPDSPVGGSR